MPDVTQLGHAGLQGWRAKAADLAAPPLAKKTPLREDQARAVIGALFFVLSVLYMVKAIQALLRDMRRDPKADPTLLAAMDVHLGGLLEELGSLREAVDAFEAAIAGPQPSLLARLALPRLYTALGDEAKAAEALGRLAEALPAGAERAAALRKLSAYHRDRGDSAAAMRFLASRSVT